jgi:hypothetical protein
MAFHLGAPRERFSPLVPVASSNFRIFIWLLYSRGRQLLFVWLFQALRPETRPCPRFQKLRWLQREANTLRSSRRAGHGRWCLGFQRPGAVFTSTSPLALRRNLSDVKCRLAGRRVGGPGYCGLPDKKGPRFRLREFCTQYDPELEEVRPISGPIPTTFEHGLT